MKDEILKAYKENTFFDTIEKLYYKVKQDRDDLIVSLVDLTNEPHDDINILNIFCTFKNNENNNFYIIKSIFEKLIPHLNITVENLLPCILNIYKESGNDLSADFIFNPFIEYCKKDLSRPAEALNFIKKDKELHTVFFTPTIIAGSFFNVNQYLKETLSTSKHKDIELKKRAIYTLGQIEYNNNDKAIQSAIDTLKQIVSDTKDDTLLAMTLYALFYIYRQNNLYHDKTYSIIKKILEKAQEQSLHAITQLLFLHNDNLSDKLIRLLLSNTSRIDQVNKASIANLDSAFPILIEKYQDDIILQLEKLVLKNSSSIMQSFSNLIHKLKEQNLISKLTTKWFLSAEYELCKAVTKIVHENAHITVDETQMTDKNSVHIYFIARKAVGYLFQTPISATSFILSLIKLESNKGDIAQLQNLIINPLALNYYSKVVQYLKEHKKSETSNIKKSITEILSKVQDYYDTISSVDEISELHPSLSNREAYRRYFQSFTKDPMDDIDEKQTPFLASLLFAKKSVVLYGNKSISYIYKSEDQPTRHVIPFQSVSTTIDFPRMYLIDPIGLDYILTSYRLEKFTT